MGNVHSDTYRPGHPRARECSYSGTYWSNKTHFKIQCEVSKILFLLLFRLCDAFSRCFGICICVYKCVCVSICFVCFLAISLGLSSAQQKPLTCPPSLRIQSHSVVCPSLFSSWATVQLSDFSVVYFVRRLFENHPTALCCLLCWIQDVSS